LIVSKGRVNVTRRQRKSYFGHAKELVCGGSIPRG